MLPDKSGDPELGRSHNALPAQRETISERPARPPAGAQLRRTQPWRRYRPRGHLRALLPAAVSGSHNSWPAGRRAATRPGTRSAPPTSDDRPDNVQVCYPALAGSIRFDEEPPPQPSPVQIRRHVMPAVRSERFPCLHDHDVRICHRRHQIDERLGCKPGNRGRPDMLNPVYEPRRQQPRQQVALDPRPVSEAGVMRENVRLLIRPCRDRIAHPAKLTRRPPPGDFTGQRTTRSGCRPAGWARATSAAAWRGWRTSPRQPGPRSDKRTVLVGPSRLIGLTNLRLTGRFASVFR